MRMDEQASVGYLASGDSFARFRPNGMVGVAVEFDDTAVFYFRNQSASIRAIMRARPAHTLVSHHSPHVQSFCTDCTIWQERLSAIYLCGRGNSLSSNLSPYCFRAEREKVCWWMIVWLGSR